MHKTRNFVVLVIILLLAATFVIKADTPKISTDIPIAAIQVKFVPVLAYHQLDNTPDTYSISSAMFKSNMAYLHARGYHTISANQYVAWVHQQHVQLPSNPILITADDGILNMFKATPILKKYGFQATAFIVTGFADGAASGNPDNVDWNATWPQLQTLDSHVWNFAFHAGAKGHYPLPDGSHFYSTALPVEVQDEITSGRLELDGKLGKSVNPDMWAVPYNEIQTPWLRQWAPTVFPIIFVQDKGTEFRYRFEIQGWMTQGYFEHTLETDIYSGTFNR